MALSQGDAISIKDFDTGTFTVTLNNMTSGGSYGKYSGPICTIMIDKIYTGNDSTQVVVGSVPEGFRPISIIGNGNFSGNYASMVHFQLGTNGQITLFNIKKNDIVHGTVIYFRY